MESDSEKVKTIFDEAISDAKQNGDAPPDEVEQIIGIGFKFLDSPWLHSDFDVVRALRGELKFRQPIHLRVEGGKSLFYRGINWIFGEGGSGKTNLAAFYAAEGIRNGEQVLWINCESKSNAHHLADLFKDMDITIDQILSNFHYRYITKPSNDAVIGALVDYIEVMGIVRVVVDSYGQMVPYVAPDGSSMAAETVNEINNKLLKKIVAASTEPSIAMIDHMPKAGGSEAYGSAYKRNNVDGHYLHMEKGKEFKKGIAGWSKLTTEKDNNGNFLHKAVCAVLHAVPNDDRTEWRLTTEEAKVQSNYTENELILVQYLKGLASNPGKDSIATVSAMSKNAKPDGGTMNKEAIEKALDSLMERKLVVSKKITSGGKETTGYAWNILDLSGG